MLQYSPSCVNIPVVGKSLALGNSVNCPGNLPIHRPMALGGHLPWRSGSASPGAQGVLPTTLRECLPPCSGSASHHAQGAPPTALREHLPPRSGSTSHRAKGAPPTALKEHLPPCPLSYPISLQGATRWHSHDGKRVLTQQAEGARPTGGGRSPNGQRVLTQRAEGTHPTGRGHSPNG